jgi:hypothetical protein
VNESAEEYFGNITLFTANEPQTEQSDTEVFSLSPTLRPTFQKPGSETVSYSDYLEDSLPSSSWIEPYLQRVQRCSDDARPTVNPIVPVTLSSSADRVDSASTGTFSTPNTSLQYTDSSSISPGNVSTELRVATNSSSPASRAAFSCDFTGCNRTFDKRYERK